MSQSSEADFKVNSGNKKIIHIRISFMYCQSLSNFQVGSLPFLVSEKKFIVFYKIFISAKLSLSIRYLF